jgi:hypothetical protein
VGMATPIGRVVAAVILLLARFEGASQSLWGKRVASTTPAHVPREGWLGVRYWAGTKALARLPAPGS